MLDTMQQRLALVQALTQGVMPTQEVTTTPDMEIDVDCSHEPAPGWKLLSPKEWKPRPIGMPFPQETS
jgi:hypothetical protein